MPLLAGVLFNLSSLETGTYISLLCLLKVSKALRYDLWITLSINFMLNNEAILP